MARTVWRGHTMDVRTSVMLAEVDRLAKPTVRVTQGAYSGGRVSASAGTHNGGGVVDLSVRGLNTAQVNTLVRALRRVGFAAWHRTPDEGPWAAHIHAVAVDCPDLSPVAARQVAALRRGRDGLRGDGPDRHRGMDLPVTTWERYVKSTRRKPVEWSLSKGDKGEDVALLQRFLGVADDGSFGATTETKVKRWQRMRGHKQTGVVDKDQWADIRRSMDAS